MGGAMILPVLIVALLGCRTTLRPAVDVPDASPEQEWNRLLRNAVDRDGYVDYGKIAKKRGALDRYVAWIGRDRANRGKGGAASYAFWINAYNALAIYQIIARDQPASVLDVPGLPWRGAGFFYWTDFLVDGPPLLSLWEIGHERVIEAQQDYRAFAVLTQGARSSPPMRAGLYDAAELDIQLDEAFSAWIMDERGVRFEGDEALFNPIFEQYAFQFGLFTHHADLCAVSAYHAAGRKQKKLQELAERGCPHGYFTFDWRLNEPVAEARSSSEGDPE